MKKKLLTIAATVFIGLGSGNLYAQEPAVNPDQCGTKAPPPEWDEWFNKTVEKYKQERMAGSVMERRTIPVIIHVVHAGEAVGTFPNLSNAQLVSQIKVLNDDFAGKGYNVSNIPTIWKNLVVDAGVDFCLATKGPNGNTLAEPGIDRINYKNLSGITDPKAGSAGSNNSTFINYLDTKLKPATIWDVTKYLNIWVTDRPSDGTGLGVANAPAGTTTLSGGNIYTVGTTKTDGLWCWAKCFGTTGTLASGYSRGRVSSHEIGHYLGLHHLWGTGSSTCQTDYCADTPPQSAANFNCPAFPTNKGKCSGNTTGEMTMNIMDYTSDNCKYFFTPDQVARIQTAMAESPNRKLLGTHGLCSSGPAAPIANFNSNKTNVCPGTSITFTDQSTNNPTSWSWSFPGGTPASSTLQNPTVTYSSAGTYNVQLVATNTTGTDTELKNSFITVSGVNVLPLSEGFTNITFPPADWSEKNINSDTIFWKRKNGVGGFGTSTSCLMFDNYYQDPKGGRDEIRTPRYNFSGLASATLTFDVAFARLNASQIDSLAVLVSNDCGSTFTQVYLKGGTTLATAPDKLSPIFVPTSSQWRTETVSLNNYTGQGNVMISFQNRGHYGQALYIDNINITGVTISTGINVTNTDNSFVIFPNPSDGKFQINLILPEKENVKIEIQNMLGQTIVSDNVISHSNKIGYSINLSEENAGIYFVKVSYGETQLTKKIIKK